MRNFEGKTALITGASRGIGEAVARYFAARGANVVLFARSKDSLESIAAAIRTEGGKASAIAGDVSAFEDVAAAVQLAVDRYGGFDILVNNAGLIEPIAHIADSDPAAWSRIVDINLKGVYYGLRAAIPVMLDNGGGTIVSMSSGAATSPLEGWSHYCSTKAAVLSLTQCAHCEYGDQGIRVVGLSPGTVATDMQVAIKDSGINPVSRMPSSAHIPPDWVARGVGYLCDAEGAQFAGTDFSLKNDDNRQRIGLPIT